MANDIQYQQNNLRLIKGYIIAKNILLRVGYENEIEWQYRVCIDKLNESIFLQEAAWVILNSGMKESVIRNIWSHIQEGFYNFQSAKKIVVNSDSCKTRSLKNFNNIRKIDAIIQIAKIIYSTGFNDFKRKIELGKIDFLKTLPFIGPITSYHLAKNIGLPVAKPDRHLRRISDTLGYKTPQDLCLYISEETMDPIAVVDIILWRISSLYKKKVLTFALNEATSQIDDNRPSRNTAFFVN